MVGENIDGTIGGEPFRGTIDVFSNITILSSKLKLT